MTRIGYRLLALGVLVIVAAAAAYFSWTRHVEFRAPMLLLWLLAVPGAVVAHVLLERRRARRAAQWSSPALLPNMITGAPGQLRAIPAALCLVALALLLVGFARPVAKVREAKDGTTIVLMVDTSGSMAAKDVPPSRLGAADVALAAFVKKLPSKYRVGLITFSSGIVVNVSPGYDRNELIAALPKKTELQDTAMGDALAAAVQVAEKAVGPSTPKHPHPPASILLVSDGGENAGRVSVAQAAQQALKAAIPVSTVLVGTPRGEVTQKIPLGGGKGTFPEVSQVPADPKNLQQIASISHGKFYVATSAGQLGQVYKELRSRQVYDKQYREISSRLAGVALVLILAGAVLSGLWFRRLV